MSKSPNNPMLSVIVPAYNRADDIATLLASLEKDLHRVEVIVVDDCSPDPRLYDGLQARHPQVRFIRQDRNRGPAAARNRGAREAKSELLFFVDSDTAVVDGTIDTILRIYRVNPEFVVCCGACDKEPLNQGLFPRYKALLEASWVMDREHGITYIGHIGSRAFTIRRSIMLQLDGFNENLPTADVEDYEFGYRVREAHGPIPYSTSIRVRHRYDTLLTQARLYFRRVIMWWDLRDQSRGADAVGSTAKEATIAIVSTLMSIALLGSVVFPVIASAALLLGSAAVVANRRFLGLCWQERGFAFTMVAFAMHTFLSWFICAGAAVAVLRSGTRAVREALRLKSSRTMTETGDAA